MSKTARHIDMPTQPAVHEFADTKTPEEFYSDSVRGLLDEEFSADAPRETPTLWERVLLVSVIGCAFGLIWHGIALCVRMFGG